MNRSEAIRDLIRASLVEMKAEDGGQEMVGTVTLVYDHHVGGFFRDATGSSKDVDYGYLMLQFDISKSTPRLKSAKR